MGEERFLIEWDRDTDRVSCEIAAFSKPNHFLSRLGYPIVRRNQKWFGRDSAAALYQAIGRADGRAEYEPANPKSAGRFGNVFAGALTKPFRLTATASKDRDPRGPRGNPELRPKPAPRRCRALQREGIQTPDDRELHANLRQRTASAPAAEESRTSA